TSYLNRGDTSIRAAASRIALYSMSGASAYVPAAKNPDHSRQTILRFNGSVLRWNAVPTLIRSAPRAASSAAQYARWRPDAAGPLCRLGRRHRPLERPVRVALVGGRDRWGDGQALRRGGDRGGPQRPGERGVSGPGRTVHAGPGAAPRARRRGRDRGGRSRLPVQRVLLRRLAAAPRDHPGAA